MKRVLDLKTRNKLMFGFGLMVVLLASVIATAYWGITSIQASQRNLYQEQFAIKQASTQNVTGTKQAEVAAQGLHDLGLKLKERAEQYKV